MQTDFFYNSGLKGTNQQKLNDGAYFLSFKSAERKNLSLYNDISNNITILRNEKLTKTANQCFIIKFNEIKNSFSIISLHTHQILGVQKKSDSNYQISFGDSLSNNEFFTEWNIEFAGDNFFTLNLKNTDLFVELNNQTDLPQLHSKSGTDNQKISIKAIQIIENGFYTICNENLALSINKTKEAVLSEMKNQTFWIQFDENDGCYSFIKAQDDCCLSVSKSIVTANQFLNLDSQKWILSYFNVQKSEFFIELKSNLLSLGVKQNNNKNDSTSLQLLSHDQNEQKFHFQPVKINDEKRRKEIEFLFQKINEMKNRKELKLNLNISEINVDMFANYSSIETLELPLSITKINEKSFENCKKIKTIKCDPKWFNLFPNPLNVENIIVSQGIEKIDEIIDFHNLKFLSLPQSLKTINPKSFANLYDIRTYEGNPKFLNIIHKKSLINVIIPDYVVEIPEKTFSGCKYLKKVIFSGESQLKTIQSNAFANCESLEPFEIPKSVDCISTDAFYGLDKNNLPILTNEKQKLSMVDNLIIDEKVTKIGKEYEDYCNIESLNIPLKIEESEDGVLKSFKKLKYIKCNPKLLNSLHSLNIKIVFIPDGIKQIKRKDFENLINLKFVDIPDSVDQIEEESLKECKNLNTIKCSIKHLKYLDQNQIKTLILNNEVKQINSGDFDELINLENCEFPDSIQINDPNVFLNCKKLMQVNNRAAEKLINNEISIKDGTTTIYKKQFQNLINLKYLEIPKSVVNIEEGTFDDCININHLKSDPKWFSFFKKEFIKNITIPEYVTEISKGQFDGFYSLTNIKLPKEIKIKDPSIFDSCESLIRIECSYLQYEFLSKKTRSHCYNNENFDFVHPIYNFINHFNLENGQETSIDDLAEFDKNNEKYCHSIMNIRGYTYSGKIPKDYKPENSDINEISKVCGAVCHEIYKIYNIIPNSSQFLSILRLADGILNNGEIRGEIGQIPSGEGKTFITTILSIILVKFNRTVDIVISNVELAKRSQKEQELFFDLFGIKTGVLYSDNETSNAISLSNYQSIFESFNLDVLNYPVVYSTIENYEFIYLHSILNVKTRERKFDAILVDEVDKMFYDEFSSPSIIANEINYFYSKDILEIIYLLNNWKTAEIIKVLNYFFPNLGVFEEENIQKFKNAAIKVIDMTNKKDYLIDNNSQINKINSSIIFDEYIIKMIEIKENLENKSIIIPACQINHHSYINLYNKICGVSGTIGSSIDEELLQKEYNINIFKVPHHAPSQLKINTKVRPFKIKELFDSVLDEIIEEREKGRPVLVIWDSKDHADYFMKQKSFLIAQIINGENPNLDKYSIENAGNPEVVTIATYDASVGIDIRLSKKVIEKGGLHVIVPMKLKNQREIENAAGRAGRQGQPGSVTFYISEDDMFIQSKEFPKSDKTIVKIERNFSNHIKSSFPWLIQSTSSQNNHNKFTKKMFPYEASPSIILNILIRYVSLIIKKTQPTKKLNRFKELSFEVIQFTWSVFLNSLVKKIDENYENYYENFLTDLNAWFKPSISETINFIQSQLKAESDFDYIIFNGIKITEFDFTSILPEKPPQIELLNGKSLSNREEIYQQLQNGEKINWKQALSNYCCDPLTSIIDDKWNSKRFNNILLNDENEEDIYDDDECEIFTIKCQQQDTWEWVFYNIKNNKKNETKFLKKMNEMPTFLTLEFIKMALNLSCEAYSGIFSIGKIIYSSENNEMFKPVFYCLEESNKLYVITRGSYSTNDWMTDFNCSEIKKEIQGTNIYFHQGFYNSALYVLDSISSFIKKYDTIFFVGHSYGASVSSVLCLLTKSQDELKEKKIYSMSFGSAPSMSFCPPEIENCIFTFINNNDLIPTFSLFNTLNTAAKNHLSFQMFVKLCLLILKPLNNKWIKELVYAIEQNFEIITDVIGILNVKKVKGVVFKIGEDKNKKLIDCIINDSKLPSTLSLSLTSLYNHFIGQYEKSIEDILS